jgi:acyl-homoserine lactone acylase PvdQ
VDLRTRAAPRRLPTVPRVAPPLVGPRRTSGRSTRSRTARGDAISRERPASRPARAEHLYRCELQWPGGALRGARFQVCPRYLIGASDVLAWGATVSNADQSDWVVVDVDPKDSSRYATPSGSETFATE